MARRKSVHMRVDPIFKKRVENCSITLAKVIGEPVTSAKFTSLLDVKTPKVIHYSKRSKKLFFY